MIFVISGFNFRIIPIFQVGGIKEKVLAAHRAGMKRIVLPKRNETDIKADIPEEIYNSMKICYAECLEDVLAEAFDDGESGGFLAHDGLTSTNESTLKALMSKL